MRKYLTFLLSISLALKLFFIAYEVVGFANVIEYNETLNSREFTDYYNFKKLIAHRGAERLAPENTLPAYEIAGKAGVWGAECDTACTKDGVWVLMHDATVDRTTNGKGEVSEYTLEAIKKLKVDSGVNVKLYQGLRVPTLEEYLNICRKYNMTPIIEIKESLKNRYDTFVKLLRDCNVDKECIVISFSPKELKNISRLDKEIKLQLLINHPISSEDIKTAKEIGNCGLDTKEPTKEGIKLAHDFNLDVNCYLVNSKEKAVALISMGVDYITTDSVKVLQ